MATETPTTLDCGHAPTVDGYALDANGRKLCYPCADAWHVSLIPNVDVLGGYVAQDGRTITTWTGGQLMRVHSSGSSHSGWNGSRVYSSSATAPDGSRWHGRNAGEGMWITMRRSVSTPLD